MDTWKMGLVICRKMHLDSRKMELVIIGRWGVGSRKMGLVICRKMRLDSRKMELVIYRKMGSWL